jgi:regulator of protease activity HflC (stomatin/prohibitin superfamily)
MSLSAGKRYPQPDGIAAPVLHIGNPAAGNRPQTDWVRIPSNRSTAAPGAGAHPRRGFAQQAERPRCPPTSGGALPWIQPITQQPQDTMIPQYLLISLLVIVGGFVVNAIVRRFRHEFIVNDGHAGLLYHEGKLAGSLAPGRHVRWGKNYRVAPVDTRKTLLPVVGQEVLTSDSVGVKLSIVLTTQILDPVKSVHAADNSAAHVYSAAQTAVRSVVAEVSLEALLAQRVALGAPLRERIAPHAESVGLHVVSVDVRDVMLPGELRKAFGEVLKARQEGQAALERARGESAALRNLANAARLIEGQPALATLRFLQTLEASNAGQTFVMNDVSALLSVPGQRGAKRTTTEPGAT